MFQRFRYQPKQTSITTAPESHDSPREEARPDTSVSSNVPHMADAVAPEEDTPAVAFDAPEQERIGDTPQVGLGATADTQLPADDELHDTGEDAEEDADSPSSTDDSRIRIRCAGTLTTGPAARDISIRDASKPSPFPTFS